MRRVRVDHQFRLAVARRFSAAIILSGVSRGMPSSAAPYRPSTPLMLTATSSPTCHPGRAAPWAEKPATAAVHRRVVRAVHPVVQPPQQKPVMPRRETSPPLAWPGDARVEVAHHLRVGRLGDHLRHQLRDLARTGAHRPGARTARARSPVAGRGLAKRRAMSAMCRARRPISETTRITRRPHVPAGRALAAGILKSPTQSSPRPPSGLRCRS